MKTTPESVDAELRDLAHGFRLPDDFASDEVVRRAAAFDAAGTVEFPTRLLAFAAALDGFAEHLRAIDTSPASLRMTPAAWGDPEGSFLKAYASMGTLPARSLGRALAAFRRGDRAAAADHLAVTLAHVVYAADQLGLDLGEAVARVAPAVAPA
ncbi:hypothetical protein [Paludisphaera soli]|uniref:hypothetical protein n=1 Tax=Paludisphaera soli TaxID=2712865 RepID=UPI0013EC1097|nr:hypothetical protein [Paludisphaera soli]